MYHCTWSVHVHCPGMYEVRIKLAAPPPPTFRTSRQRHLSGSREREIRPRDLSLFLSPRGIRYPLLTGLVPPPPLPGQLGSPAAGQPARTPRRTLVLKLRNHIQIPPHYPQPDSKNRPYTVLGMWRDFKFEEWKLQYIFTLYFLKCLTNLAIAGQVAATV